MSTSGRSTKDAETFLSALMAWRSAVLPKPLFREALASGGATRNGFRTWVREHFFSAYHFPRQIAALLARCEDEATFHEISANFSREAGWYETPYHAELMLPFGKAVGVSREDFYAYQPTPQSLGLAYAVYHLSGSSVEEGIGAIAMAMEGIGSTLCTNDMASGVVSGEKSTAELLEELYGFSPEATTFWRVHKGLQERDVNTGLGVVGRHLGSKAQRDRLARAFRHATLLLAERDKVWAELLVRP